MHILFVHPYFPGQFDPIARHYLVSRQNQLVALHRAFNSDGRHSPSIDGVRTLPYGEEVREDRPRDHVLAGTDRFVREAASAAIAANALREEGWYPDLVYSHAGWGAGAFLHDIFPKARFVKYCEWFYNNTPDSTEFLGGERPFESRIMTSLLNIPALSEMMRADLLIAPTEWQKSQFPQSIRRSIEIAPDGVDTEFFRPDPDAVFETTSGRSFRLGDRVITYVARGADPFRGFRQFLDALAVVQSRDSKAEAIVVGDRKVYYGPGHGTEVHFKEVMDSARIDPARTHFVGRLDYATYRRVLQVSGAHVYLTVPFVLSWSALEALSTGCAFVGSDTAPVREFVEHRRNGLLAEFFDSEAIAAQIEAALAGGADIAALRKRARDTILDRWRMDSAVDRHLQLVSSLL